MDIWTLLVGLFFVAVGAIGIYVGVAGCRKQNFDWVVTGVLVTIMSAGMVGIGALLIIEAF